MAGIEGEGREREGVRDRGGRRKEVVGREQDTEGEGWRERKGRRRGGEREGERGREGGIARRRPN